MYCCSNESVGVGFESLAVSLEGAEHPDRTKVRKIAVANRIFIPLFQEFDS
jgi:hypothetical protein